MKKSLDEYGNEKHAYEWIKDYLRLEGEKRFGEIKRYLADHRIEYASDKGLDLALKSLIESGDIGKHRVFGESYPVYYIRKKRLNHITSVAEQFRHEVLLETNNFIKLPHQDPESDEEYLIRNLIHTYGIYNLFVQMKSWRFTSVKKSHSENFYIRHIWQNNTLPIGNESFFLEEGITELVGRGFNDDEPNYSVYKIYANKKKWNKLLELEELFKKMYPHHIEFFEKLLAKPLEETKTLKELINMTKTQAARKNRIIRKNTKNLKKI